jgi:hypothetical protein
MNNDLFRFAHLLDKGGLFRIHDGRGRRVECLSGCLWLTEAADPRDTVLEAGDGFTIDRNGDTYLSALSDSRFVVLCNLSPSAAADRRAVQAPEKGIEKEAETY